MRVRGARPYEIAETHGTLMGVAMTTGELGLRPRRMAVLVAMALGLGACGGGGGNSPVKTVSTPPSTPPATAVQPPIDAQLSLTNTYSAHAAGYTGAGVTIGIVDSGVMASHPALAGRVVKELTYVNPNTNNLSVDDVSGHGTYVAQIAAGAAFAQFPGGIAPGADIVSARIIDDNAPDDNGSTTPTPVTSSDAIPLGQVNADLIANGVKVMNNSWGGVSWSSTDTVTTQGFHDAYNTFINSWGGLVVFAAGNDSQANPSTIAALPSLAPDLEKGWLTVVALNSNSPTQLASYSNKCGIAMNYCLAAPGNVIATGKNDTATNASYWIVEGTSLAAPQVSGAAALVWQAYPYFSNDLVRQTLLGTADPLGGSQPNTTFGYGGLDVGKAVNGPELFNWGDVTVNFSGTSSWNNPISGAGGLIKQGPGTLTLTQPSTYTGLTQVQGGMLVANSLAANVSIGAQGVLSTTPSIGGSVTNAGVLAVTTSDTMVAGNYTQQGAGRLAVALGSALRVTGTATLGGGDLFVLGIKQGYFANLHTDVLTAVGGINGTFSALNEAPGVLLTASLNYSATDAWLNVSQVQASAVQGMAYTPASFGAAQRVDGAFTQINTQVGQGSAGSGGAIPTNFISGAANLQQTATTSALQQSLSSLSGQLHAASAAMTFDAIDAGTRALSNRFDQLADVTSVGGWTQSLGDYGSMSRSGYSNVGYDLNGWMVGQDRRFGSNGVVGFAVSQSQDLGRLDEFADQGQSRAVEGMLYGGISQNQWYAMGRFGVGSYREDMRRHVELGSDVESVASDTNGRYRIAYGESGYRMSLGGVHFTPYVNLQYANIETDGFNELGGDGFGLKANAQTVQRWQAGAGLRAGSDWALAGGGHLSLQGHVLWQRAFSMSGDQINASFAVLNQWAPLGGIGLSRYGGDAGLSLDWAMTARSTLSFGVDQYVAQHDRGKMSTLNYRLGF